MLCSVRTHVEWKRPTFARRAGLHIQQVLKVLHADDARWCHGTLRRRSNCVQCARRLIEAAPRSLDAQDYCTFSRFSRFCTPMPDGSADSCGHASWRRLSADPLRARSQVALAVASCDLQFHGSSLTRGTVTGSGCQALPPSISSHSLHCCPVPLDTGDSLLSVLTQSLTGTANCQSVTATG